LIGLALAGGLLMLLPRLLPGGAEEQADEKPDRLALAARAIVLICATALISFLALHVDKIPDIAIAYGRTMVKYVPVPGDPNTTTFKYVGEGMNSSVAVTQTHPDGAFNFHVSGKIEASTLPADMRLQRMLGHVPALLQKEPKSVLIVGCGAGVTAGTFTQYPSIQRIVICEIEPLIPEKVTPYFGPQNYHIVDDIMKENPITLHTAAGDKQLEVIYDDGRHFMLTTKEKFDIITSDPIHPWVKGSAVLYTQEYFQLCKDHLNPGGMVTQWVPFYESTKETVHSELKTFFSVFPDGTLWSNDQGGDGYDALVLGMAPPAGDARLAAINVDEAQARLDSKAYLPVVNSLADVGFNSALDLLKTYGGSAADMEQMLLDAPINRDRDLRLQYLAGFGANLYLEKQIYSDIKDERTYPENLFSGSPQNLAELRAVLKAAPKINVGNLGQMLGN